MRDIFQILISWFIAAGLITGDIFLCLKIHKDRKDINKRNDLELIKPIILSIFTFAAIGIAIYVSINRREVINRKENGNHQKSQLPNSNNDGRWAKSRPSLHASSPHPNHEDTIVENF
jgi:hypothetical protein